MAIPACLRFDRHFTALAFCLARASAGSNIAARMAMMAITTSSSISVKAWGILPDVELLRKLFISSFLRISDQPQEQLRHHQCKFASLDRLEEPLESRTMMTQKHTLARNILAPDRRP